MDPIIQSTETLSQALSRVWQHDWQHRRSGKTLRSQAEQAIASLGPDTEVSKAYLSSIRMLTASMYKNGLSPATIQKRLNCLSKLGVSVEGCRVNVPKQLKWYLKESDKAKVIAWLVAYGSDSAQVLASFIEWTTLTGLRVEESLRLTWQDIDSEAKTVSVPGLKTASSQATLPLSHQALCSFAPTSSNEERVFPISYTDLIEEWQRVRIRFNWHNDPTATLKALRRSAARYLHVDCSMPLDMVRQYLRHEKIDTTMEYLRLTGGYGTEEMRRYLK